jgi:hypothetical protein
MTNEVGRALFSDLIVNATLQAFKGTDANKAKAAELISRCCAPDQSCCQNDDDELECCDADALCCPEGCCGPLATHCDENGNCPHEGGGRDPVAATAAAGRGHRKKAPLSEMVGDGGSGRGVAPVTSMDGGAFSRPPVPAWFAPRRVPPRLRIGVAVAHPRRRPGAVRRARAAARV